MLRRSIIRGLAIALLTLCVTAWVGSYCRIISLDHGLSPDRIVMEINRGRFVLDWSALFLSGNWQVTVGETDVNPQPGLLGFFLCGVGFFMPLWFPTTLSAGLLWLVWRKTRPKYTGKGFPVEPAAKPTKA